MTIAIPVNAPVVSTALIMPGSVLPIIVEVAVISALPIVDKITSAKPLTKTSKLRPTIKLYTM